jgi:hypothetical protein
MSDLKQRIAASADFTPTEKLLLQEAINTVANTSGVVDRSNPTWRDIPAEKVFDADTTKRCPTCGAGL